MLSTDESLTERPPTSSFGTLSTWSRNFGWVERSKAWDRETWIQDEQDYLRFWKQYRGRLQQVGEKLLNHAQEMLEFPLAKSKAQDGDRTILIEPAKWQLRDITAFTAESLRLVEKAVGPVSLEGLEIKQAQALDLYVEPKKMDELHAISVLAQGGMASPEQLSILSEGIESIRTELTQYNAQREAALEAEKSEATTEA